MTEKTYPQKQTSQGQVSAFSFQEESERKHQEQRDPDQVECIDLNDFGISPKGKT